jgi:hypothetical protein
MKVDIQAEIGAKALHDADQARFCVYAITCETAFALHSKQFAVPNAKDLSQESLLKRAAKSQPNRQCQDPLANATFGHDPIDKVGRER